MNTNLVSKIICNATGVFDNFLYTALPFKQDKLKNVFNYIIFLKVIDNKLELYAFEDEHFIYKYRNTNLEDNEELKIVSLCLAKYIYGTEYYKQNFKSLTYSLYFNLQFDLYLNPELSINIYTFKYIPEEYYKLTKNDIYNNIKIISHLLYKEEHNNYILNFEKNLL